MFFEEVDFETFNEEYVKSNAKEIVDRRKKIQGKLLDINKDIRNLLSEKYNLHNCKREEHITSSIYFHTNIIKWIGIRYGKLIKEKGISLLNFSRFQLDIDRKGIEMSLFHSTSKNNWDMLYVREQLDKDNKEYKGKLICEIEKIQGYRYECIVDVFNSNQNNETQYFKFDDYKKEDVGQKFIEFYEKYCKDNNYIYIQNHYPRKDERISDKESIEKEFLKHIERLYPLYKVLSC